MRAVAILVPLLFLFVVMPAARASVDECANAGGFNCQTVTTSGVPGLPPAGIKTYYVYPGVLYSCPANSNSCHGVPPAQVLGLVWEETNGLAGLQRGKTTTPSGLVVGPDTVIVY